MKCWTICTPRQSAVVFVAFISRANLLGVAGYDRVLAVSHLVQRTERFDLGCIPRILKFYIKSLLQIFYICSRDHLSFVFFGLGLIFLLFFFHWFSFVYATTHLSSLKPLLVAAQPSQSLCVEVALR